jgi:hypothetical protein
MEKHIFEPVHYLMLFLGTLIIFFLYCFIKGCQKVSDIPDECDPDLEIIDIFYIFSIDKDKTETFSDFFNAREFAMRHPYMLCRKAGEFKWVAAHKKFNLKDCYVFKHPSGQIAAGYYYDEKAKEFALKHPYYEVAWVDFDQKEGTTLKWEKLGVFFNMNHDAKQ